MFFSKAKQSSISYTSLSSDDDDGDAYLEMRSSSKDAHSTPLLKASDDRSIRPPSEPSRLPTLAFYFSLALVLLSAVNIALLPTTLKLYHAYPFSDSEIQALRHGDARLGLDRAAEMISSPEVYHRAWPDRIARVSRKLKNAVWGQGVKVYITVEDSTIMRFPVPSDGVNACAISWMPPPKLSSRVQDITTKGDVTEIEVWQLIAPPATSVGESTGIDELDYDNLSYSTLPVRGELLGTLDFTAEKEITTVDFACPSGAENLTVELRCQRVGCHVSFMQIDMVPRLGFSLLRWRE